MEKKTYKLCKEEENSGPLMQKKDYLNKCVLTV